MARFSHKTHTIYTLICPELLLITLFVHMHKHICVDANKKMYSLLIESYRPNPSVNTH